VIENLIILAIFLFFVAVCWPYGRHPSFTAADTREEIAWWVRRMVTEEIPRRVGRIVRAGRR